jgi:flagellar basal body-associated protein FliL
MNLIEKLENLINKILIKLGELVYKIVPRPLKVLVEKYETKKAALIALIKQSPTHFKPLIINQTKKTLASLKAHKDQFQVTYKDALSQYKEKSAGSKSKFKKILLTPFLIVDQWLKGLSTYQSLMLMGFSCASILAVIGIGFSGQKLLKIQNETIREPASVVEEPTYDRPGYYKKQTKHFGIVNFRLPVYVAQVNEIHAVDMDFTATLSNRSSRMYLEKNEFQLRDHLILQIEPSVASFPLTDEGKDIIRDKLLMEINEFLRLHNIDGQVVELKITYVLAN